MDHQRHSATATSLEGRLVMRGADDYEQARVARIYHSRYPDRYPAAILLAETENDVVEGVRLARERGWTVAIRAGGHSFPVWSLRDNSLLIDLGNYREMSLDADTGIVSVTPAVTGGEELNHYLQNFGRFFPSGGCPSVGVGGFLLQGGIGWNFRGWGWAAEQVTAIDVVTADGDLVRADETTNADLFWAARGAGPGFPGAITRFYLRTRPLPAALTSLLQVYPVAQYPDLIEWLREHQTEVADTVHLNASILPPPFPVPGHVEGEPVIAVWAVAFCETPEEAADALAALVGNPFIGTALMDTGPHPTTLDAEHAFVDSGHPAGLRYQVDSAWVQGPTTDIVAASRKLALTRPQGDRGYTFFQFTFPRSQPDMALSLQTDVMVGAYLIWEDPALDEEHSSWLREAMRDLEPYTVGQYWGDSDQQHRQVKCLTDDSWTRLQAIVEARDPHRLFAEHLAGEGGYRNVNEWAAEAVAETPGPASVQRKAASVA